MNTSASGGRISISADDLAPLPATATKILQCTAEDESSFGELERIISEDPSFALRVLRIANSSFYGCRRQIGSIRNAVAVLGTNQVRKVASALAMAPLFDSELGPQLWRHAVSTALWSEEIVKTLRLPALDHLFLAALTHDVGLILLLRGAKELQTQSLEIAQGSDERLVDIEDRVMGTTHAEAGATLCRSWNLPGRIGGLIEEHHRPLAHPSLDTAVVAAAEYLAARIGASEFAWMDTPAVPSAAVEALGLDAQDLERLLEGDEPILNAALAFV